MDNQSLIIIIDGKDKTNGSSSDFKYQINRVPIQDVNRFRINKIIIPYTFYTIENQNFTINYNGIPYVIAMPAGNYIGPSLAATVQGLVNSTVPAPGLTITYNINTNRMDYSTLPGNTYWFEFGAYSGPRSNYNVGFGLGLIRDDINEILPPGSVFTSPYQVYLVATRSLYIKSQKLRLLNTSYFNRIPANVIQTVPINVNSTNMIIWQNESPIIFYNSDEQVVNLDFQVVDDFNNLINLNGYDIILEIQMFSKTEL